MPNRTVAETQLFFEIALSIGNATELKAMLKEALTTYLKKLNCLGAVVVCGSTRHGQITSVPRRAHEHPLLKAALSCTLQDVSSVTDEVEGQGFFHLFELPGFGCLALARTGKPLDPSIVASLEPLNKKLAQAGLACIQQAMLEREVEERRLRENELRRARDLAEEANRSKSLFLANMSHEIRTPMNGVLGMAELLESSELSPTQLKLVRTIQESGRALLRVIDDVLDIARVERGKLELHPEPFDLHGVVSKALDLLQPSAKRRGLELRWHVDADVPSCVTGDAHRLRQVLINLVNNALKYTETGHVSVHVDLGKSDNTLRFRVRDTGIGISPEKQDRLFEAFHQVDASYSRARSGLGLGLAISREIVHLMGGQIGLDSTPGVGSTFWFTAELPRAEAQHPPHEDRRRDPLKNRHILLAEDDRINQAVASAVLRSLGATVEVVANGQNAVDAMMDGHFDAILMDVQMPVMDGLEATRAIRDLKAPAGQVPIIALTAHGLPEHERQCREAGMDDYATKPVSRDQLTRVLARHLSPATS